MSWHDPIGRLADPTPEEFAKWVSAQEAFAHLIGGVTPSLSANLVNRLKNEVLYGAASIAKFEEDGVQKTLYRVSIDKSWWAPVEGGMQRHYDALWAHGDITLVVPDRIGGGGTEVHFFGVRFEPQHLRDATPAAFKLSPPAPFVLAAPRIPTRSIVSAPAAPAPEPTPADPSYISAEEFADWLTPEEALKALPSHWDGPTKIRAIASRLLDGLLKSAAEDTVFDDEDADEDEEPRTEQFLRVPRGSWTGWACLADPDFWASGNRQVYSDTRNYYGPAFRAYRIKLDPAGIAKIAGLKSQPKPSEAITSSGKPTLYSDLFPRGDPEAIAELRAEVATLKAALSAKAPHPGGAPPKPWWDDLWVEMFRQIWESDLQPTSMSDIAVAMQQWALDHDYELSISAAKRSARKLWAVAKPKGS